MGAVEVRISWSLIMLIKMSNDYMTDTIRQGRMPLDKGHLTVQPVTSCFMHLWPGDMLIDPNLVVQRLKAFVESEPSLGHSLGSRASGGGSSGTRSSKGAASLTRVGTGPKGQLVLKRAAEKEKEYWQRLTKVGLYGGLFIVVEYVGVRLYRVYYYI